MSKSLEDVKAFLEGQEGGIELYEAISKAIIHERDTAKGQVFDQKRKTERYYNALGKLGYKPEEDLDGFLDNVSNEMKTGKKTSEKLTTKEQSLTEALGRIEALEKRNTDLETRDRHTKIKNVLNKQFKDKVYSADNNAELLILKGAVDLEGENVVWVDGDNRTDFGSGFKTYLEKNPDIAINSQRSGASGSASGESSGQSVLNRSAFDKLNPFDAADFITNGGKLTD